jgi:plastocyanin
MNAKWILFPTALGFVVAPLFAGAVIEGTVALPPALNQAAIAATARYQLKASGKVAQPDPPQAIVYLEGDFGGTPAKQATVDVAQRNFQFSPGVLPVQRGTRVQFPNLDDDYHSVFSYSKPKRFDLGRYRKDEKPAAQVFDKPGLVKLYCEIHEHMRGAILVVDTPHFTKTDTNGTYKLENLPAGKYTLKCWVDEKTLLEKPVELKDSEVAHVDFGK